MSGPAVVAVGGGHGLAASLAAVRCYAGTITAVVSVADDGGSSGRLRAVGSRPAPGDLRKCLVALADERSALARAMEHRFDDGDLAGHAFGNLLILALAESGGGLVSALDEAAALLGAAGRVLPTTAEPVHLRAEQASGATIEGQVAVSSCGEVAKVMLDPPDAAACPEAVEAIMAADQVVLGPGSLYTSVLAATAVRGIHRAIVDTDAQLVYVCNLRPQHRESTGYDVAAHVRALALHGLEPEVVLHDPDSIGGAEGVEGAFGAPVALPNGLAHHPELLGKALEALLDR